MPVSNGTGAFNTGRDCTIVLVGRITGRVEIPNITHFDAKPDTTNIKVKRLDGVRMTADLPDGWSFRIEAERGNSALDDVYAAQESLWQSTGTLDSFALYQYIAEAVGQSTWQIDNCSIKLDDPGEWKSDTSVKQRLSGMGSYRRRVL